MQKYEIEIKSLLGDPAKAEDMRTRMKELDPNLVVKGSNKQLNHYFVGGDIAKLQKKVSHLFSKEDQKHLEKVVADGSAFSVRTRELDGTVLLVVKASIDDTTSENGISRIEFEAEVPELSLEELDQLVLGAGFQYQAKWSREREEYGYKGAHVCLDRNAGYGYLAEFEKVIDDPAQTDDVQKELRSLMDELGAVELAQDRLERMFAYYNEHWPEYYGTDKVFVVE